MTAMPLEEDVPVDEAYFIWLYSQVGGSVDNRNRATRYLTLLRILHKKEFTWDEKRIPKDANRAQDGKDLRVRFLQETTIDVDDPMWLDYGCSMLELLITLAFKLAWDSDGNVEAWFWEMINNLTLKECSDAHPPDEMIVNHILDQVINRDYTHSGRGGLFPLQHAKDDQRNVQLWDQLEAYLLERIS